ncbi:hypothetical protein [Peribacillus simplex]|uniref:tetratricopeptide repeat protein n=1 Tax=Peribacillus simplex TaxID=1478 RepID=UPI0011AAB702|nr:hypothetical protein [Peribacillus simplex]
MAIFNEYESVTEDDQRSLALFTDRRHFIRRFAAYLNEDPAPNSILYFYGDGGNGKSLLLKYLYKNCCKRLKDADNWMHLQSISDIDFVKQFVDSEDIEELPVGFIDFGTQPREDFRPLESFSSLLKLRRDLAHKGLKFPVFDYASILYLHKTNKLTQERVRQLFPSEELDLVASLLELSEKTIPGVSQVKAVLSLFSKKIEKQYTLFLHQRKVDSIQITKISQMDPDTELINELPKLFAQDLNKSMELSSNSRVILLFDTHESFWGHQRNMSSHLFFEQDEWLRCLLGHLDLDKGIVVAVAGREVPNWEKASKWPIPARYLEKHLVDHLQYEDALWYLHKAEIQDPALVDSILSYTEVAHNEYQPFYLGLCIDVVLQARSNGVELQAEDFKLGAGDKAHTLVQRLLRYVDLEIEFAVNALSACRNFDFSTYELLGEGMKYRPSRANFEILKNFSFVWKDPDSSRYRIHDLLRRILFETGNEQTKQAHSILEQHYRRLAQEGSMEARVEFVFHHNRLNPEDGVKEWVDLFKEALFHSQFDLARLLLQLSHELLGINMRKSLVCQLRGDFYKMISKYSEAKDEFVQAVIEIDQVIMREEPQPLLHIRKGTATRRLALLLELLSEYEEAAGYYHDSINEFERAIELDPENGYILDNQAQSWCDFGDLLDDLSRYEEAEQCYQKAIELNKNALMLHPEDFKLQESNISYLSRIGNFLEKFSRREEAEKIYQNGIAFYRNLVARDQDSAFAYYFMGTAIMDLAGLKLAQSLYQEAHELYLEGLSCYEQSIAINPDDIDTLGKLGRAFSNIGHLFELRSDYEEARENYQKSIGHYNLVLDTANQDIFTLISKSNVLGSLGGVEEILSCYDEAETSYLSAIEGLNLVLLITPNHLETLQTKANIVSHLAALRFSLAKEEEAELDYHQSISIYESALQVTPRDVVILYNLVSSCIGLGNMKSKQAFYPDAERILKKAIDLVNQILEITPHDHSSLTLLGTAEMHLAKVYHKRSRFDVSLTCFNHSIQALDDALQQFPENLTALKTKVDILGELAHFYDARYETKEAAHYFRMALQTTEEVIQLSPNDPSLWNIKGSLLKSSAKLEKDNEVTKEVYLFALESYDQAICIAPEEPTAIANRANVCLAIAECLSTMEEWEGALRYAEMGISSCDQCLSLIPDYIGAWLFKGALYASIGGQFENQERYDEAGQSYNQALSHFKTVNSMNPNDPEIYFNLGKLYFTIASMENLHSTGKLEENSHNALKSLDDAIRISPNPEYFFFKGSSLALLAEHLVEIGSPAEGIDRYQQCINCFEQVIQSNQKDSYAYYLLAKHLQRTSNLQYEHGPSPDSESLLQRALKKIEDHLQLTDQPSEDVYFLQGTIYGDLGEIELQNQELLPAIEYFDLALESYQTFCEVYGNDDPTVLFNMGNTWGNKGEIYSVGNRGEEIADAFSHAIAFYEKAIKLSDDPDLFNNKAYYLGIMAEIDKNSGNIELAENAWRASFHSSQRACELNPEDPNYLDTWAGNLISLAEFLRSQNKPIKSKELFHEAYEKLLILIQMKGEDQEASEKIRKVKVCLSDLEENIG